MLIELVNSLARGGKPIVLISFGSPYVVGAFPDVSSYLFAWGGAPICQRAAVRALFGERAIAGKLPISIPPLLKFGDGISRAAIAPVVKEPPAGSDR